MKKRFFLFLIAIYFVGCTNPMLIGSKKFVEYFPIGNSEIDLPKTIDTFDRGNLTEFKDEKLGFSYLYTDTHLKESIDVFIYPVSVSQESSLEWIADLEFKNILRAVEDFGKKEGESSKVKNEKMIVISGTANGKKYQALKSISTINSDGTSFTYLAMYDDIFIKIRYSIPTELKSEKKIDHFVSQLLTRFKFNNPKRHKHEYKWLISNKSNHSFKNEGGNYTAILYAGVMGKYLEDGDNLQTYEQQERFWLELLKRAEKREKNMPRDKTLIDLEKVVQNGYLREYLWKFFNKPYWDLNGRELKEKEFNIWEKKSIHNHKPYSNPEVLLKW